MLVVSSLLFLFGVEFHPTYAYNIYENEGQLQDVKKVSMWRYSNQRWNVKHLTVFFESGCAIRQYTDMLESCFFEEGCSFSFE